MVNVFSFCLYGREKRLYYEGLMENIELVRQYFPDWKVYVYCGSDVTPRMIARLKACSNVVLRWTDIEGPVNMIHRFFAIDEPDVEVMFSRDADSRIHWKDRWAIRDFLDSPYLVHTIRDNVVHNAPMMGGLWGMKKAAGIPMREAYEAYIKNNPADQGYGKDQNFLMDAIYIRVVDMLLAHYSHDNCRYAREALKKFPFEWINDVYCGRVEVLEEPKSMPFRSTALRVDPLPLPAAAPAIEPMAEPPSMAPPAPASVNLTNLLRRK
jgi:hypothetical protein